jgi:hypothetical protein
MPNMVGTDDKDALLFVTTQPDSQCTCPFVRHLNSGGDSDSGSSQPASQPWSLFGELNLGRTLIACEPLVNESPFLKFSYMYQTFKASLFTLILYLVHFSGLCFVGRSRCLCLVLTSIHTFPPSKEEKDPPSSRLSPNLEKSGSLSHTSKSPDLTTNSHLQSITTNSPTARLPFNASCLYNKHCCDSLN